MEKSNWPVAVTWIKCYQVGRSNSWFTSHWSGCRIAVIRSAAKPNPMRTYLVLWHSNFYDYDYRYPFFCVTGPSGCGACLFSIHSLVKHININTEMSKDGANSGDYFWRQVEYRLNYRSRLCLVSRIWRRHLEVTNINKWSKTNGRGKKRLHRRTEINVNCEVGNHLIESDR